MTLKDAAEIKEIFIAYWLKVSQLGLFPFTRQLTQEQAKPLSNNEMLAWWLLGKFYQPMLSADLVWQYYAHSYLYDFNNYLKWQVSTEPATYGQWFLDTEKGRAWIAYDEISNSFIAFLPNWGCYKNSLSECKAWVNRMLYESEDNF